MKVSHFYLGFVFLILIFLFSLFQSLCLQCWGDMNAFTGFTLEHFNELFADSRLMLSIRDLPLALVSLTGDR